jgi:hypothetical protein
MEEPKYIKAFYTDEEDLIEGIKALKEKQIEIYDVLTPFPVHGLDKILGYKRSRISRVGFIGGAIGAITGFVFQAWVFTRGYPMNIGGKPFFAVPSFIPVTFELAVLFAAFSMVFAFLIRSKLGPGAKNIIHDERITDDRFVVLTGFSGGENAELIKNTLSDTGASDITVKNDHTINRNY